jgi:serine/threonine protein kinase
MTNYRLNIVDNNNLINYTECKKLIEKQDISNIGKGGQADIFKVVSDKCGSIVLKLFRKNLSKSLNSCDFINLMINEYNCMCKVKLLIDYRYCANFISILDFNPKEKYIIMEYADGDSTDIIKYDFSNEILYSFMCQVLIGLLCFQKILNYLHNDLKLENILYKKINKQIILRYVINNQEYYIPTYGYLFMIADYGLSLDKSNYDVNRDKNKNDFIDIERLKNSFDFILTKMNKQSNDIKKIQKILEDKIPILNIIKKNFIDFTKNNNYDSNYVETFTFNF